MRILVTGHLGYIGPIMVRMLKAAGHYVTGFDVGYFRECVTDAGSEVKPDREIIRDIRDISLSDVSRHDATVHLAGLSNDPMGSLDPKITNDIYYVASMRLATLAKQSGHTRFVFASSCSLYGSAGGDRPLNELAPLDPISAYAQCKAKAEQGLANLADENFSPVFLRNATAYGISPRMRFDLVLNNLMAWAKTTGTIKVLSDGTPWRPLVHIQDICRAALAALEAPVALIHNQAFNIGRSDANYTVKDIAETVAQTVSGAKVVITGETGGDPRSYRVDFSKAENTLPGFAPEWTVEKGCEELNRWFSEGRLGNESFESRFFVRLKQLKYVSENGLVDSALRPTNPL